MIIKNNTPKEKTLHYKVGGKIFHIVISAYGQSPDIEEITHEDQLQLSTYERRLRHIETHLGKSFVNPFSIPSDSEFTKFTLTSAIIGLYPGTIAPTSASVAQGDDKTFTITLPASSRTITVTESTPTLGTITPNGSVITTSVASLLTFIDNSIGKALTPITSTSSAYTITNVASAHTLQASFNVITTARTFSVLASGNNVSVTASASGGTITLHSGVTSVFIPSYLNALSLGAKSFINSATGNLSGASSCVVSGITAYTNTLTVGFNCTPTATTITMSASTNAYTPLKALYVNGLNFFSAVTGSVSGSSSYNLPILDQTTKVVQAIFYSGI